MKKYLSKFLFAVLLVVPVFSVFKSLFFSDFLFGGDAPYFYKESFSDIPDFSSIFTERGIPFGGVNKTLWMSPLMRFYEFIGEVVNFDNTVVLKILFLFPALTLSFIGPGLLVKSLKLSKTVQFFASFVYVFNTYFILLIDGGQVGVALAYGVFPFAVLFLNKLAENSNLKNFLNALLASFALCLADPRIFAIAFIVSFVWSVLERRNVFWLAVLLLPVFLSNLYWLYPLWKAGIAGISSEVADLKLLSLINPLMLYSPHWPDNLFGKITYPPFYFALVPILVLGSYMFKKKKRDINMAFLFLFFAFLAKGANFPFGEWYSYFLNNIPALSAFRDSSKFFMPVILFAGILIGLTAETLPKFKPIIYLYLLFLIYPSYLGKMNFLLSNHVPDESYSIIYNNLKKDGGGHRTLWLTSRHPLSFETKERPAVDGTELAKFRPFASMNASEDVFNFLNNSKFSDWLRVLGFRYVFLSGDARNIYPSDTDKKNWDEIKRLVSANSDIEKNEWGTSFDIFEVPRPFPETFYTEEIIAVVGPDLDTTTPAVYLEDGKWDPKILKDFDPGSVKIFLRGKEDKDFAMSLLRNYFLSADRNVGSDWAFYGADDYLKYKYELLIRNFKFDDFDYGLGVAFSTREGEKINFKFNAPENGDYILAIRKADLKNQSLAWVVEEKLLNKGSFEYSLVNESGTEALNAVALVPKDKYAEALKETEELIKKFGMISEKDLKKAEPKDSGYWKIVSQNYIPSSGSLPIYSMISGYYQEQSR